MSDKKEMSVFAKTIMEQKYSHEKPDGTKESWEEISKRVSRKVLKAINAPAKLVTEISQTIESKKFMPGGRYLYASGRQLPQVQNCLGGGTEFITDRGIYTLAEMVEKKVRVQNYLGEWEDAEVKCFGEQELFKVTLANGVVEYATANHAWTQPDGSRPTTMELESVMRNVPAPTKIEEDGIRHGIIFGDGHLVKQRYSQLVLCGDKKQELSQFFCDEEREIEVGFGAKIKVRTVRDTKSGKVVSLQPPAWKTLPNLSVTPSYARGFIAGLIATDGCVPVNGSVQISCEGLNRAKQIAKLATLGGCVVNSVKVTSEISPFDGSKRELSTISLKPIHVPVIRSDQKARLASRKLRSNFQNSVEVESVESTGRFEPVYCVVAPKTHSFTLASGIVTGNCLLLKADDSREGWADLMQKATMALMTGAGIGVVYSDVRAEGKPIRKTGGHSTGPIALMQMVNEAGRGIMQGGSRRSAIWAGLHWNHQDVMKFIHLKDWSEDVRAMKLKDYNFPATLDGTNVSVILDDLFFEAYGNEKHSMHSHAQSVYWSTLKQMLKTAEPGFSIDVGVNKKENLRNAPVSADTFVLTNEGYKQVRDIVGHNSVVWTGKQWATTEFKKTKTNVPTLKVNMSGGRSIVSDPEHEFVVEKYRGLGTRRILSGTKKVRADRLQKGDIVQSSLPEPEIHRFDKNLYSLGHTFGRIKNSFPEEIVSPSDIASFMAGLFDSDGKYDKKQHRILLASTHKSFLVGTRRALETIGIQSSVSINSVSTGYLLMINGRSVSRFSSVIPTTRIKPGTHESHRDTTIKVLSVKPDRTQDVFCCDVGVAEHTFMADGVIISNCCEVTSEDDSDICNLGSINMANIDSLEEMDKVVKSSVQFLLAGTVYSCVPYPKVDQVRTKNRRLGLGLMGIHEWLLKKGKKYGPDPELEEYLKIYAKSTDIAREAAVKLELTPPVKTRAIAPTGTIGIIAETTTGLEPIFCVAYKRRYLKGNVVNYQYVIDPCAQRLIDSGINPDSIEDAYSLAENVERRIEMQHWLQKFVDHAISSTVNIPQWGSEFNNESKVQEFGKMLMKYLPGLRGVTCYPDGARGGQPLTPVKYSTAIKHTGEIFVEQADVCDISKGGSCGS